MVNEATKVELTNGTGNQRRFTVADGTAITKGSILKLTDPRTAIIASGTGDALAGIAAMDKVANDGSTSITVWTDGIFEMTCSGSITVGMPVQVAGISSENYVMVGGAIASGAIVLGYALETGSDEERINVRVRL
jgi:hypothetical protein